MPIQSHLLRADLHIPIKVPEPQHTLRLLCYGVTGAHTESRTERTPCSSQAAIQHFCLPDMLMRAIGWPVLGFSAPPPDLPFAARCEPFKEVQTPRDREELGIDLGELIFHKPSRIPWFALRFICTSRASVGRALALLSILADQLRQLPYLLLLAEYKMLTQVASTCAMCIHCTIGIQTVHVCPTPACVPHIFQCHYTSVESLRLLATSCVSACLPLLEAPSRRVSSRLGRVCTHIVDVLLSSLSSCMYAL